MAEDQDAADRAVDTIALDPPSFRAVRRGYDPDEVDAHLHDLGRALADLRAEVDHLRERELELGQTLTRARDELRAREQDVSALMAPGSEGERLVEAARTAALEIRTRAQLEANDIIKAANDEVRAVRADAEQLVVRRGREADELAAARLSDAKDAVRHAHDQAESLRKQTEQRAEASLEAARTRARSLVGEAEAVRARAQEDADAVVAAAEARGHELIEQAQEVRDRIVAELGPRRQKLRTQVEQLQAGRDRLLAAYQVVRAAMDEATVELEVVLPEARDAALAAAARVESEPDEVLEHALARLRAGVPMDRDELDRLEGRTPSADVRRTGEDTAEYDVLVHELGVVVESSTADGDEPVDGPGAEPTDGEPAGPVTEVDGPEGGNADADADPGPGDEDAALWVDGTIVDEREQGIDPRRRVALAPDPIEGRWSSAVRIIAPPAPPEVTEATAESDGEDTDDEVAAAAPDEVDHGAETGVPEMVGAPDPDEIDLAVPAVVADDVRQTEPSLPASLVGGLFDRSHAGPEPGTGAVTEPLDPVALVEAARDEAVAGPRRALRRRLKGSLVEEENELLDAIRQVPAGVPKAHEVLPGEEEHRERFVAASRAGLLAAWVAGQDLGARLSAEETRRRVPGALPDQLLTPAQVDEATVDAIARRLAIDLATELRARLAACFPVGPPAPLDARAERRARDEVLTAVRSAYRGTKGGFVDRVSDQAVFEAAHRAVRAQVPAGVQPAGVDIASVFPIGRRP